MVFPFCGNVLPRDIQGLTFGYTETHFPGITPDLELR